MAANEITYKGKTYTKIVDGNCYLSTSLISDSLEIDTLTVTIESDDRTLTDFKRNDPLVFRHNGTGIGIFYLRSVDRISRNQYKFKATSRVGILADFDHMGGVYTGEAAGDVIKDICKNIPVTVTDRMAAKKLYGWLPIDSARNNLARVLFSISAVVKTGYDGSISVIPLGTDIVGEQKRVCQSAKVEYAAPITEVTLTEHRYVAEPSTEEESLFEGTSRNGDVIKFYEPMHSLRATGFTIQSSGANYAIISSGSGELFGKPYIHNQRDVSRPVSVAEEPNIKTITDATLVNLLNSGDLADRLAEYYKCKQTIKAPTYFNGEKPGDRIRTVHPYDLTETDAVVQNMDISLSNILKENETMLVGYVPPKDKVYEDRRVVLTGSGEWQKPAGCADTIRFVAISGAQGGQFGGRGQDGANPKNFSFTHKNNLGALTHVNVLGTGLGGEGGKGGVGGSGGRILEGELMTTGKTSIKYSCGIGGLGATTEDGVGSMGTDTTIESFSTAGSLPSEVGYVDIETGERYADSGLEGISGGNGSGYDGDITSEDDIGKFTKGNSIVDESGKTWEAGNMILENGKLRLTGSEESAYNDKELTGSVTAIRSSGFSGGAAGGANGPDGPDNGKWSVWRSQDRKTATAKATSSDGANGANATLIPNQAVNGCGGRGGYGGGGGAPTGYAYTDYVYYNSGQASLSTNRTPGTPGKGGTGYNGGQGSDGLIILYYKVEVPGARRTEQ